MSEKLVQHKTIDALIADLEQEVNAMQDQCVQLAQRIAEISFDLLETMPEDEREQLEAKLDELMFLNQEAHDKVDNLQMQVQQLENF